MTRRRSLRSVAALAWAQIRHDRMRTGFAILGVALAVLAMTLLSATGVGVLETGQHKFESADRDLWITGGPVRIRPSQVGGLENSITNAHRLSNQLNRHPKIATAAPLLFQSLYISPNGKEFTTIGAMGVPSSKGLQITQGEGWNSDPHYANGTYTGPMTGRLLIDRQTADQLGLGIGDTVHVGGTIATARKRTFTVVGISPTGSQFRGTLTIAMPMSELQEVTSKTTSDPATLIAIKLKDNSNIDAVQANLTATYPQYEVRTNREQLQAVLGRQAVVLAGAASLVIMAIAAGVTLTFNVLLSMLYQQRKPYAALVAIGISIHTLRRMTLMQAIIIGLLGAAIGLLLTIPAAMILNQAVRDLADFEQIVRVSPRILWISAGVALVMSFITGLLASRRFSRLSPHSILN